MRQPFQRRRSLSLGETPENNQNILDGSFAGAKFHVGANANDTLTVNVKDARASSLGRMARYEVSQVGDSAIDAGTALSFRSADTSFYAVRDTAATDDADSSRAGMLPDDACCCSCRAAVWIEAGGDHIGGGVGGWGFAA